MLRQRFVFLLGALTLLIVSGPLVALISEQTGRRLPASVTTVVFALMLIAAVVAVSHGRAGLIAGLLAVPWLLLSVGSVLKGTEGFERLQYFFSVLFLLYIIVLMLKFLFSVEQVTFDTISASLCVYLLFGVLWSIVFAFVDASDHEAFAANAGRDPSARLIRFEGRDMTTALYYSFVTMSTLGYGDIVPVSPIARMLSAVEAMMGQLYLAVLVARLVGLHIAQNRPR